MLLSYFAKGKVFPKKEKSLSSLAKISIIGINTPIPRISKKIVVIEEKIIIKSLVRFIPQDLRISKIFLIINIKLNV